MRLFKTKWFVRTARKNGISDSGLREAIKRAQSGLVDADLGGHLIKQRVAREGQGKRGGFRVIVAFDAKKRAVFLLAFAKNEKDNITSKELESLKTIAALWLEADEKSIERSMKEGELAEVKDDEAKK
jgi:hypothetical protein